MNWVAIRRPFYFVSNVSDEARAEHPHCAAQQLWHLFAVRWFRSFQINRRSDRAPVRRQFDQCEHISNRPGDATLVIGVSYAKSTVPQRRSRHFRLPSRLRSWARRSPHLVFLKDEHNLGRRRGRKRQGVCFNIKIPLKRRHDELNPNSLPLAALERDFECLFLMIVFRFIPREPIFMLTSPLAELLGMFIETLRLETPNGSANSQTQRKDRRKRRAHLLGYMRRMLRSHQ